MAQIAVKPHRRGWKKADVPCEFSPSAISLLNEEWRPVVGWERHYRVSNLGRIYSLHQTGRFVSGMRVRDGYRVVKLRSENKRAHLQVHCMVLEAFIGPRPDGMQGCHGDGNPSNCALENLRWDTPQANQRDRVLHGTVVKRRGSNPLNAERVRQIRSNPEVTLAEWASKFGCSVAAIAQARRRATWKTIE